MDSSDELIKRYWERFAEEQIDLEDFCRQVRDGAFEGYGAGDLRDFLGQVEANMLRNIETMLEANPGLAPLRDERVEETQRWIADLMHRYASPRTSPPST